MRWSRIIGVLGVALVGCSGGATPDLHRFVQAEMVVCVVVAFGSAVYALLTPMKRRWAWALLALVGAGTFAFNWTTGQGRVLLLNLLLFDAAFEKPVPAAPWVLQVAFPIGALMTLRRVRNARHAPAPAVTVTPVEPVAPMTDLPNEPSS